MFVFTGTLLAFFLLGASLAHILVWSSRTGNSFGVAISEWRVPFAMLIYSIVILPYPSSLVAYHIFLMWRGETTREYLNSHKFPKGDRHRPFTRSNPLANIVTTLFRPRGPPYLLFASAHEEGDQRFGQHKMKEKKNHDDRGENVEMRNLDGRLEHHTNGGFQGPRGRTPINRTPRRELNSPQPYQGIGGPPYRGDRLSPV